MRAVACTALLLVLAGCGGDATQREPGAGPAAAAAAPMATHVHGVGVDGGRTMVATHDGLLVDGRRVGPVQDLMGFTVAEPGVLLASGHPGPGQQQQGAPANIGLLRSQDGGRSWAPVALAGEVDFHALAASGDAVYGFDGATGRLLASADGGRTWDEQAPPGSVLAMAVDPGSPRRVVASTSEGLAETTDGGRRWRVTDPRAVGLLAWTARGLVLAAPDGTLQRTGDGGRTWSPAGTLGAPPVALAADGDVVVAAFEDGAVRRVRVG